MNARTFNCRCRPSAVRGALDAIREMLSEETIHNLREISMFSFFDMPPYPQDNVFTLHIIRCWDNERGAFKIGGKEVKLHADHVALLIGLPNRGEPVSWKKSPLSKVDARQIKNQITNFFAEAPSTPPFDVLYLKFILTNLFFPSSNFHVPAELAAYAEDVASFPSYNWPAAICEMLIEQVRIASQKLRHNQSIGYIQGFVFLLTLWFYEHTSVMAPASPDARPRMLRWPTNHGLSAEKIHETFKRIGHVNDGFMDLNEDEAQLLSNPEQGPPSPPREIPPTHSTAGPSSPKSYARGTIVSSDITPAPAHTTEGTDFGVLLDMMKAHEQISLNIQETVAGISGQMGTVVETLSNLTGLVQRLFETKADKPVEKRKVDRPVSQYQFKRRQRTRTDEESLAAPVDTDVREQTHFSAHPEEAETPAAEVRATETNIPIQSKEPQEISREAEVPDLGDETVHEDPAEIERAIKGVLQSLSHSTLLLASSAKEDLQAPVEQRETHSTLEEPDQEYQHISSPSGGSHADEFALVPRDAATTIDYPGRQFIPIEMQTEIDECLSRYGPSDVIIRRDLLLINRSALEDILLNKCLSDEHVDIFAAILQEKSTSRPESFRKYLYVSPMFGMHSTYGSEPYVRHITKESIANVKAIFFPIIHNQHWILLVMDLQLKRWRIYDSLPNQMHKAGATAVINMFLRDVGHVFTLKLDKWQLTLTKNVPTQNNSVDCGMFVCKYMELLAQAAEPDWTRHMNWQNDMAKFRSEFVYELCRFSRTAP